MVNEPAIVPMTTPVSIPSIWPARQEAPAVPQGWECPKCHTIYAPAVLQCHACSVGHPRANDFSAVTMQDNMLHPLRNEDALVEKIIRALKQRENTRQHIQRTSG